MLTSAVLNLHHARTSAVLKLHHARTPAVLKLHHALAAYPQTARGDVLSLLRGQAAVQEAEQKGGTMATLEQELEGLRRQVRARANKAGVGRAGCARTRMA
eukprot:1383276-Rhodomonas_salina.2